MMLTLPIKKRETVLLAGRSEDKCSRACNSPGKIKSGGLGHRLAEL